MEIPWKIEGHQGPIRGFIFHLVLMKGKIYIPLSPHEQTEYF